jgi:uncharacterized membrane protein
VRPRWLYIALIVSLAINLFGAGLIVGARVVGRQIAENRPIATALRAPIWRAGDGLDEPYRQGFRKTVREAVLATRDDIREGRRLRTDAIAKLAQPNYDAATVNAELQQGRALEQRARGQVEAAIIQFATTLPPDQRAILAQGLNPPRPPRPQGPQPPGPPAGPPPDQP